jgi:hypothetical protein
MNIDGEIQDIKTEIQSILDEKDKTTEQDKLFYLENNQDSLLIKLQNLLYSKISISQISLIEPNLNEINQDTNEKNTNDQESNTYTDTLEFPGMLFFHESIMKMYGLCPFLKLNDSYENVNEQRSYWLKNQQDRGKTYYELYDKIINEKDIKYLSKRKNLLEEEIQTIINSILDVKHKELYNNALVLLEEYISSKLKTKKIKEKYKNIVFIFSEIFENCHIGIHEYVSEMMDVNIIINANNSFDKNEQIRMLREHFKDYIEKYKALKIELDTVIKYSKNTKKHLLNAWNTYINTKESDIYIQTGKYFKKWSCLSEEEHLERLESFSKYFISRKLNFKNSDNIYFKKEEIDHLFNFLKDSYKKKELKFNYLKWNIKTGVIDCMPGLIIENSLKNTDSLVFSFKIKPVVPKRPQIAHTIFSKENEQKINEYILTFILKNKNQDILDVKYKELCFENIKLKLNFKKISKSDKIVLNKKFEDIFTIVDSKNKR